MARDSKPTVTVVGRCPERGCPVSRQAALPVTVSTAGPRVQGWRIGKQAFFPNGITRHTQPVSQLTAWPGHRVLVADGWVCEQHDRFLVQVPVPAK